MVRALLFDLDGTLVDSRRDIAAALNHALVSHGRRALALEEVLPLVGDGSRKLVARAFAKPEEEVDAELEAFRAYYMEHPAEHTRLLPGGREAIAVGLPWAVVTNKPKDVTLRVLAALGLHPPFVWGGGDGALKPDPAGVFAACAALGVPADAGAWMIGDGPQDVTAGRRAGCFTVTVPGIGAAHATSPDLALASLAELPAAIRARRA